MKNFIKTVIIFISILALSVIPVNAESKYIEKRFEYEGYSPTIIIHHPVYNWVLEAKSNGTLSWAKPVANKSSQIFTIIPTGYTGYYGFREFNNGSHTQRYITYTKNGFKLAEPKTDKYGMEVIKDTQLFKFTWKTSGTCGGKTFKNVWRLPCKNNICMTVGGWGYFIFEQTNYYY